MNADKATGWFATSILYVGFLATGIGMVLPGALLPLLLARWSLNDEQAGALFFIFFIGSLVGALLARWSLPHSIARGCIAVALGATLLGVASRATAFAAVAVYGVGLGIVMTSVSVLVSRRHAAERTAHITRLNLAWALGACLGPWFGLRGAEAWGPQWMLFGLAAFFAMVGALTLGFVEHVAAETVPAIGWWQQARAVPGYLLLMVPLATGIESATGGWLATYSKRSGQTLSVTIGETTCFWAGLLLSRLVQSNRRVATASERPLLRLSPWLISIGLTVLIVASDGPAMLAGALLLGIGVGPMYPALLALVLSRGEGGNSVFVIAGIGAAMVPLLTGLVSGSTGSLRLGLGVPLAGALVMALCGWLVTRAV
jgi:FHS family glucose/mannose:H+ symporter-like MFS transporter